MNDINRDPAIVDQVAWALHLWSCPLCWVNGMEAAAHSNQDHVTESDRAQASFLIRALGLARDDD